MKVNTEIATAESRYHPKRRGWNYSNLEAWRRSPEELKLRQVGLGSRDCLASVGVRVQRKGSLR